MLIQKGGIFRNIDPKNLQKFKDKGYAQVEQPVQPAEAPQATQTPVPPAEPPKDPKK